MLMSTELCKIARMLSACDMLCVFLCHSWSAMRAHAQSCEAPHVRFKVQLSTNGMWQVIRKEIKAHEPWQVSL